MSDEVLDAGSRRGSPALQRVGQHGDGGLIKPAAFQVLFTDQVITAGKHDLFFIVGEIDQETQVRQHGLGDGACDGVADFCRVRFSRQREQCMECLRIGGVTFLILVAPFLPG